MQTVLAVAALIAFNVLGALCLYKVLQNVKKKKMRGTTFLYGSEDVAGLSKVPKLAVIAALIVAMFISAVAFVFFS